MSKNLHFWINDEVVTVNRDLIIGNADKYYDIYHVDENFDTESKSRYGMYTKDEFKPIVIQKFPLEFRMQLLLLGVT